MRTAILRLLYFLLYFYLRDQLRAQSSVTSMGKVYLLPPIGEKLPPPGGATAHRQQSLPGAELRRQQVVAGFLGARLQSFQFFDAGRGVDQRGGSRSAQLLHVVMGRVAAWTPRRSTWRHLGSCGNNTHLIVSNRRHKIDKHLDTLLQGLFDCVTKGRLRGGAWVVGVA